MKPAPYPSQTPEARRAWRENRRNTVEAAATRCWTRLWRKAGGKARGRIASGAELVAKWHAQGGRCALTGLPLSPEDAHLDHVIPRSKGGAHTVDNLQWVHSMANLAKGARTPAEFQTWLLRAADSLRGKLAEAELLS